MWLIYKIYFLWKTEFYFINTHADLQNIKGDEKIQINTWISWDGSI